MTSLAVSGFLQILDENDNRPVFLYPVIPAVSVVENNSSETDAGVVLWHLATSGHVVLTVRAIDADDGPNADVEYSLTGGNDDSLFNVDRKLGHITLMRNLHGTVDDQVINTCDQVKPIICTGMPVMFSVDIATPRLAST